MEHRFLILCFLLVSGCANSPELYGEIGAGYKINKYTDPLLRTENTGGRNPTAHFEVGLDWGGGKSCGLRHFSHYRDGGPFNERPETYMNEIICKKRWGGK